MFAGTTTMRWRSSIVWYKMKVSRGSLMDNSLVCIITVCDNIAGCGWAGWV
jgi:hypothetical protein